ncbi:MAG: DUF6106 family protein [Firmicutes bacterium]|nr:DUF6106 family protein [Bacillota bacterium]
MDFFNEYIVTQKKGAKEFLLIFAMIVGAILLILLLTAFAGYLQSFFLLLLAGVIYMLYIGISAQNIEYEYIVTNGELDIDKIAARRKRTRVISAHSRNFEYFAPLNQEHMAEFNNPNITKRFDFSSNTKSPRVYFVILNKDNEKTCFTFEPTDKMLDCFSRYVPRNVFYTA